MEIVYNVFKLPDIDPSKKIYICNQCDNVFNWSRKSSWYGSLRDSEENPEKIIYACSEKCMQELINKKKLKQIKELKRATVNWLMGDQQSYIS